jgi:hypothetical protein
MIDPVPRPRPPSWRRGFLLRARVQGDRSLVRFREQGRAPARGPAAKRGARIQAVPARPVVGRTPSHGGQTGEPRDAAGHVEFVSDEGGRAAAAQEYGH